MATAIEYGLIAAFIGMAGIVASQGLVQAPERPLVVNESCQIATYDRFGNVDLDCGLSNGRGLNLHFQNSELALAHTLAPGTRFSCDLYEFKEALCSIGAPAIP